MQRWCQALIVDGMLQAMVATAAVHTADEAAQRILPAAAPLAVDQIQDVRHAALACISAFAQILTDHNRTLDDALSAAGSTSPASHHPILLICCLSGRYGQASSCMAIRLPHQLLHL